MPPESRATEKETSVLGRVSMILNLFSEAQPSITLADVGAVLGVSQASAYRYLHNLHEIGLLSRTSGRYTPGPKVLELEYISARFDPVISKSRDFIDRLSADHDCHVLLGRLYGSRLINVYSRRPEHLAEVNFAPGRRMPLFRGSQARVVLASLDRRRLKRIFDLAADDPERDNVGRTWKEFSRNLQKVRQDGYYISRGELDSGVIGIASALFDGGDVIGGIVMAYPTLGGAVRIEAELVEAVITAAGVLTQRISDSREQ